MIPPVIKGGKNGHTHTHTLDDFGLCLFRAKVSVLVSSLSCPVDSPEYVQKKGTRAS